MSLNKGRRMLTVDGCALNVTSKVSASSYTDPVYYGCLNTGCCR